MGCKASKSTNNAIVPTRLSAGSTLGIRTQGSQNLEFTPDSGSKKSHLQTFSDCLAPHERQRRIETSDGEESLKMIHSEKSLPIRNDKRRVSILESIRQQIREDDLKAKQLRLNAFQQLQQQQKPRNVYKIKINGRLVAEAMSPRKHKTEAGSQPGFRVHRERSMTESTNTSHKKGSLRTTPKNLKRKMSDGDMKKPSSIVINLSQHPAHSMPNLDHHPKVTSPTFLRIPTPDRVRIKLNFETSPKFLPKVPVRKNTGDDGVTTEKSDSCSLSSIGHE